MKRVSILLCVLAALAANARPADTEESLESQLTAGLAKASASASDREKPNEIMKGGVTYSGIAVQLLKTGNPLQLLNPAAPPQYGSAEDNVIRDPFTGTASAWKIFSIQF